MQTIQFKDISEFLQWQQLHRTTPMIPGQLYRIFEHDPSYVGEKLVMFAKECGVGLCLETFVEGISNRFGPIFLLDESEEWFDNMEHTYENIDCTLRTE